MEDEAHKVGLRIAHHVGVEETNAWDDIHFGTTSIEHWYGIPDAAIPDGVQDFPGDVQLQQRDGSLPLCRPSVARGRSARLVEGARRDGRAQRRVGADARHLRGEPRSAARADAAVVRRLSASDARGILPARSGESRLVLLRLDVDRRDVLEGELPNLDERRSRFRAEGRPHRRRRRCGIHLPDVRLRLDPRARAAPGSRVSARSRSFSTPPATTRRFSARRPSSGACARASRPT